MKYVMSDLHGRKDLFDKMLKEINFNNEDELIILGDVIDRGSTNIELLEYILNKENIELLTGNHEQMMLDALEEGFYNLWLNNGGRKTYKQYLSLELASQKKILDSIKQLPKFKVIDNFILVHAGLRADEWYETYGTIEEYMKLQDVDDLIWSREEFYKYIAIEGYTVIFGHTPTKFLNNDESFKIWHDPIFKDKIGIDCGAFFSNKLACLRLDDMKEFYVENN